MATITLVTERLNTIIIDEALRPYITYSNGKNYPLHDADGRDSIPQLERITCFTSHNELRFFIDEEVGALSIVQTCGHEPKFGFNCLGSSRATIVGIEYEHIYDPAHPSIHLLLPDGFSEPIFRNFSEVHEVAVSA